MRETGLKIMFHGVSSRNSEKVLLSLEAQKCRITRLPETVIVNDDSMFSKNGTVDPLIFSSGKRVPEFLRRMRKLETCCPLIVISEEGMDAAEMLDAGADDVLRPPFDGKEIKSRIMAISRRISKTSSGVVSVGDLQIDIAGNDVTLCGKRVGISTIERRILGMMAMNHPKVTAKASIYQTLYGMAEKPPHEKVIDSHIHNIRRKITSADEAGRNFIRTVIGVGYELSGA